MRSTRLLALAIFWNCLEGVSFPGQTERHASVPGFSPQTQSPLYVGETFRAYAKVWRNMDELRRVLPICKEMGINLISIDIAWGDVEKQPGVYDFSFYDARLEELVRHGFAIQIKINLLDGPNGKFLPRWVAEREDWFKRTSDGRLDENHSLTFASDELNALQARFCKAVARNCRKRSVVNYSLCASMAWEVEYDCGKWQDYSPPAQDQFRQWLKKKYKTVERLNEAWGSDEPNFEGVQLPNPGDPAADGQLDCRAPLIDFCKYREDAVDVYFGLLARAIRSGDSKAQVALTVGHVLSEECGRRGTLSAFRWLRHADWLWVDPDTKDDYPLRMAEARGALLMGKKLAVELTGGYHYRLAKLDPLETHPRQTRESLEGGASMVTTANWRYESPAPAAGLSELEQYAGAHRGMGDCLRPGAVKTPRPADEAIYLSKWSAYAGRGNSTVWNSAVEAYRKLIGNGERQVDIVSDDVFLDKPSVLKRYRKIHIPCAPVVSRAAHEALLASGVPLEASGAWGMQDEYGKPIAETEK